VSSRCALRCAPPPGEQPLLISANGRQRDYGTFAQGSAAHVGSSSQAQTRQAGAQGSQTRDAQVACIQVRTQLLVMQ